VKCDVWCVVGCRPHPIRCSASMSHGMIDKDAARSKEDSRELTRILVPIMRLLLRHTAAMAVNSIRPFRSSENVFARNREFILLSILKINNHHQPDGINTTHFEYVLLRSNSDKYGLLMAKDNAEYTKLSNDRIRTGIQENNCISRDDIYVTFAT